MAEFKSINKHGIIFFKEGSYQYNGFKTDLRELNYIKNFDFYLHLGQDKAEGFYYLNSKRELCLYRNKEKPQLILTQRDL